MPFLWRFHSIHHSTEPLYVLGFGVAPLFAYVAFVSIQATFIHANIRFEFGALRWVLATPRFHHWHHGAEREAIDKNFAVHLPMLDWLFGTFHLPHGRWPKSYGLAGGRPLPQGFARQLVYPFLSQPRRKAKKMA